MCQDERFIVATHGGRHHADDILACWFMRTLLDDQMRLVRTNDAALIDKADFALDTGGVFNPDCGRFDHHAGAVVPRTPPGRRSGYATAGLVWREKGQQILEQLLGDLRGRPGIVYRELDDVGKERLTSQLWERLDRDVVVPIDKWDLGRHPSQDGEFLPIQWLLPHLDFAVAVSAIGEAFKHRFFTLAMTELGVRILYLDMLANGPCTFYEAGENTIVVGNDEEGARIEWASAERMVRENLEFPLYGLIVPIRKGQRWSLMLNTPLPPDTPLSRKFQAAPQRRTVFSNDKFDLLELAKKLANPEPEG